MFNDINCTSVCSLWFPAQELDAVLDKSDGSGSTHCSGWSFACGASGDSDIFLSVCAVVDDLDAFCKRTVVDGGNAFCNWVANTDQMFCIETCITEPTSVGQTLLDGSYTDNGYEFLVDDRGMTV